MIVADCILYLVTFFCTRLRNLCGVLAPAILIGA
jgi:hypothetical protein